MHGQPNGLTLVGESSFDRLFDPPRSVGAKLAALTWVETLDGFNQANVTFADEIQKRKTEVLVVVRDFYDQAQVGLDHVVARGFVSLANPFRESNFLCDRKKRSFSNFFEVQLQA